MPPHFHPHPMPRPRPRFRGGYTGYYPYPYYETQVIEVDRTAPQLPWRVLQAANGVVLFQSASMADALKFFKSAKVGVPLVLQRWAGNGWQTESGLSDAAVDDGVGLGTLIMASLAIIGVYYFL